MRAFLTFCFIAVAASEKLGYNYNPSSSLGGGIGIGGGYSSGSGFGGSLSSGSLSSGGSYNSAGGLISGGLSSAGGIGSGSYSNGVGISSGGLSSIGGIGSGSYSNGGGFSGGGLSSAGGIGSGSYSNGGGFSSGGLGSNSYTGGSYSAPAQVVTELNKEYYFHSAPEEAQDASNNQNSQSILKKNLRVVFIKAPENNGLANAALQVVKQATEDQTAIYVLTKQADVSDITQQLQQVSEVHSKKPEVHFVKYRTQEDALNAQRTIQAQYDALGGSSKSSNEGIAPVLNYASSAPVSNYQGSASQASQPAGSYSSGGSLSASAPLSSYSAPSGTGSYAAPSASYLSPKSSYLPPVSF